jgi:uncharacterized protein
MGLPIIHFYFHGDLVQLLPKSKRQKELRYRLTRRASIKDILESMGIPHTEIGRIEVNENQITFAFIPDDEIKIDVYPMSGSVIQSLPNILWPDRWFFDRFMVDVNALKLARNMRMAGIDTMVVPQRDIVDIAMLAATEERVIITRNRQLLKCAEVGYGQLLRSEHHIEQLREVNNRFHLGKSLKPFSRCLRCNGLLQDVSKDSVVQYLEPLTEKYYSSFRRCLDCLSIYWEGSHIQAMKAILAAITWK